MLIIGAVADIPALHPLIEASVRGLQANDYTPAQIEGAPGTALGIDTQLIADCTYLSPNRSTESGWQAAADSLNARLSSAQIVAPTANSSRKLFK